MRPRKERKQMALTQYVDNMRKAVEGFYNAAVRIANSVAKNNSQYLPDIAKEQNRALMEELQNAQWYAQDDITEALEMGRAAADRWNMLSGAAITDDARLLKLLELEPMQFNTLVDKYRDNATMLTLLKQYAEKRNAGAGEVFGPYDATNIPTAEKKKEALEKFAQSGRGLIQNINDRATGAVTGGLDSELFKQSVNNFGKRTDFNAGVYDLL